MWDTRASWRKLCPRSALRAWPAREAWSCSAAVGRPLLEVAFARLHVGDAEGVAEPLVDLACLAELGPRPRSVVAAPLHPRRRLVGEQGGVWLRAGWKELAGPLVEEFRLLEVAEAVLNSRASAQQPSPHVVARGRAFDLVDQRFGPLPVAELGVGLHKGDLGARRPVGQANVLEVSDGALKRPPSRGVELPVVLLDAVARLRRSTPPAATSGPSGRSAGPSPAPSTASASHPGAAAASASRHARTDSPASSSRLRSRTAATTWVESVRALPPFADQPPGQDPPRTRLLRGRPQPHLPRSLVDRPLSRPLVRGWG
jgi:hypothetical protein